MPAIDGAFPIGPDRAMSSKATVASPASIAVPARPPRLPPSHVIKGEFEDMYSSLTGAFGLLAGGRTRGADAVITGTATM
jgi:hypothetical protein